MKTNIFTLMKTNPLNTNVSLMKTKMLMKTKFTNVQSLIRFSVISFLLLILGSGLYAQAVPELIYYKFDITGATAVNHASAPVGINPAPILGLTVGGTGQFGTGLVGNGGSSSANHIATGWNTNLGAGNWTISLYVNNTPNSSTLYYHFGDLGASGFRCFTNGVAGNGNLMLRQLPGFDCIITGVGFGAAVCTWVYDGSSVKGYLNGVLNVTSTATGLTINGTGFTVGGYSSSTSIGAGEVLDEFRVYNRALSAGEVLSTWNIPLGSPALVDPVTGFTANAISTTQIDLAWTNNAAGDDVMLVRNTTPTFNAPVDGTAYTVGGSIAGVGEVLFLGPGTAYNDMGLNVSTTYYYQAFAVDAINQYSWASGANATTLCGIITAFPWLEPFSAWPPNCFAFSGQPWLYYSAAQCAEANFYSVSNAGYTMITPAIDLSGTTAPMLAYDWSHDYLATYPLDELTVSVSVVGSGTWTVIDNLFGPTGPDAFDSQDGANTGAPGTFVTRELDISAWIGSTVEIRFYGWSGFGPDLFIDNITVFNVLVQPVSAFQAVAVSQTEIDLSWTNNLTGDNVMLVRNTAPTFNVPADGTIYPVGGSIGGVGEVIFNGPGVAYSDIGLNSSTPYYYQAYAVDAINQYSPDAEATATTWFAPISNFPYLETFDSNPSVAGNCSATFPLNNWWVNEPSSVEPAPAMDWAPHSGTTTSTNTGPTGDYPNGTGKYLYTETSGCYLRNAWVSSPPLNFSALTDPYCEFWYHMYSGPTMGSIEVVASVDNGATWSVPLWSISGNQGNQWNKGNISLGAFAGMPNVIVQWRGLTGNYFDTDMALDYISFYNVLVSPVTNFNAIVVSATEIALVWNNNAAGSDVMLVRNTSPTFNNPVDGTLYPVGSSIGGVGEVIHLGQGFAFSDVGLMPNTTYYYQIWAVDPILQYSPPAAANGTTPCDVVSTFPWLEDFNAWPPDCFTFAGQPWLYYAAAQCAEANYYSVNNAGYEMITPVMDLSSLSVAELAYDWSHDYLTSYPLDELTVSISVVGSGTWTVLTHLFGPTGSDAFDSQDGATNGAPGTFVTRVEDISAWIGSSVIIKFYGWSDSGPDLFIDNITVFDPTAPPSCTALIDPLDGQIDVSAYTDVEWVSLINADGYYVYMGTDGGGTVAPTNIANGIMVSGNSWTPPAMLPFLTTVYWQIVPYNSFGTASGCPIWEFIVQDIPVQTIPFFDGFETGNLALYWDTYIGTATGNKIEVNATAALTGSYGCEIWSNTSTGFTTPSSLANAWDRAQPGGTNYSHTKYMTVMVDMTTATSVFMDFDYNMGFQYQDTYNNFWILANDNSGSGWVEIFGTQSFGSLGEIWRSTTIGLDGFLGNIVSIRFLHNGKYDDNYVWLDNINIDLNTVPAPCANLVSPTDGATGVNISDDVSWTPGSGVTGGFNIYMGTDGGGTALPTNIYNGVDIGFLTSYPFSGFAYSTTYYWSIVPYNGIGAAAGCAVWSFTTMADPIIVIFPHLETFDSNPSLNGSCNVHVILDNNWINELPPIENPASNTDWTPRQGTTPTGSTGPSSGYGGSGKYLFTESSSCYNRNAYLTSPPLDLTSLPHPVCSFQYSMYGATMGSLSVVVSGDFGATWSPVEWTLSGNQGTAWHGAAIDLSPWSGIYGVKVRWMALTGTSSTSDMAIDHVLFTSGPIVSLAGVPITMCLESSSILTATPSPNAVAPISYQWADDPTGGTMTGFAVNPVCDYELRLLDSYGDGWNGNTISVFVNGAPVINAVTLASGAGPLVFPFTVSTGDDIHVQWFATGSFASECSFYIYDAGGTEIYSDGLSGAPSTAYNFVGTADCPTAPSSSCNYELSLLDSYGDGWNGNTISVFVNGTAVLNAVTLSTGLGPVAFPFSVSTGDDIHVQWFPTGSYQSECSFYIYDEGGTQIYSDGLSGVPSTAYNFVGVGDCPYIPPPPPILGAVIEVTPIAPTTVYTVTMTDALGLSATDNITIYTWPKPFVDAFYDATVCTDNLTQIYAVASVGQPPFTYSWTPTTNISDPNIANPIVSPTDTTVYYVIVTDANGCVSEPDSVVINTINQAIADIYPQNIVICDFDSVQLTATGGTSYQWVSTPPGFTSTLANPWVSPHVNTTYHVAVTSSCGTNGALTHVTVNPLPFVFLAAQPSICLDGAPFALTGGFPAGGGYSGHGCSLNTFYPLAAGAGDHTITYTFTDGNGCTNYAYETLHVFNLPTAIASSNSPICENETIDLTGNGYGGDSLLVPCSGGSVLPTGYCLPVANNSLDWITEVDLNGATYSSGATTNPNGYDDQTSTLFTTLNAGQSYVITTSVHANGNEILYAYIDWNRNGVFDGGNEEIYIGAAGIGNTTISVGFTVPVDAVACATVMRIRVKWYSAPTACETVGFGEIEDFRIEIVGLDPVALTDYDWTGPLAFMSSMQNPSIPNAIPGMSGDYILTVTDQNGCTDSDTAIVVVNPLPVADAGLDVEICLNECTDLTATGGVLYAWSNGGMMATINVCPTVTTTYTVTVTDANGCTDADDVTVIVNPLPVADAGSDIDICLGDCPDLTATGGVSYEWSTTDMTATINVCPVVTTTYTVTVTDANGCTDDDNVIVTVNPLPTAAASSNSPVCAETILELYGAGMGSYPIAMYDWTGPNGFISMDQNPLRPNMSAADAGTYTLMVSDINGCTATASTDVVVLPLPQIDILNGDTMILCQGFGQIIDAVLLDTTNGPFTWLWSPAAGLSNPNIPDPIANPNDTTIYTVAVTDINGCVGYASVYVAVHVVPIVNIGNDTILCFGSSVPLTANILNPHSMYTFLWTPPTGLSGTTTQSVTAIPVNTITYTANVSDALAPGCVGTDNITISIDPAPPLAIIGLDTIYCLDAPPAVLHGYEPGGTFSGPGVYITANDTVFVADSAGVGVHTITYSYISATGCPYTISIDVVVNPIPAVYAGLDMQICTGSTANLNAIPSGGTIPYSFSWESVPAGFTSVSQNPVVNPLVTTQYIVTVTDVNGCTASDDVWISIDLFPVAIISPTQASICEGDCIQLFGSGGNTYQWNVTWGDANSINNPLLQNPTVCPTVTTRYELVATSGCGAALDYITVVVFPGVIPDFTGLNSEYCLGDGSGGSGGGICGAPGTLTTTWAAGNSFDGNMFDVIATNTITISSFDVNIGGATTVEVYYRPGSWVGNNMSSAGWTLLGSYDAPTGGVGTPTPVPIGGLVINAGETYGLYVTTIASGSMSYSNIPPATPPYSDPNITIDGGQGGAYPFALGNANRMWNGNLHYVVGDGSCGLTGIPQDANGVFTGPGIVDNGDGTAEYNATVSGLNTITYTYTTADGCVYSTSQNAMVHPLPTMFNVAGGGAYCAGGAGFEITLDGSEIGVEYELYADGVALGIVVAGDGNPISFGNHNFPGTYSVYALNLTTLCHTYMTGSVDIIIIPGPVGFAVTGGGSYCNGGAGVEVGLANTQLDVTYQMFINGVIHGAPVAGTGSAFSFGLQVSPGVYTVFGINDTTGCTNSMAGSVTIIVNPVPAPFNVTGGGSFCFGGNGVEIGLDYSQASLYYELYRDGMATGNVVPGNGGPITFGDTLSLGGVYTVLGINTISGCTNFMFGSADIVVLPLPVVYDVTGGGIYCPAGTGVEVGLSNSEIGVDYFLHIIGNGFVDTIPGTGGPISFGDQTTTFGVYTLYDIAAKVVATGCVNIMNGYVTVMMDTNANFITQPMDLAVEEGQSGTFSVVTQGTTVVAYQWQESTNGVDWFDIVDGGIYSGATTNVLSLTGITVDMDGNSYRAVVNGRCLYATAGLNSDEAVLTVMPIITTIIEDVYTCAGDVIVPITVEHFYQVASISLTLNVDTSVLLFDSYINLNPALAFGTIFVNQFGNQIIISWFNTQNANIGNGTLLELKFSSVGGTDFLTWDTLSPGKCQYNDVNFTELTAHYKNGNITVYELPEALANSNSPVCWGDDIQLYGSAVDEGEIATYYWVGPVGFTSYDKNPVITYADSVNEGTYTLTVTDTNGCFNSASTYVRVDALPVIQNVIGGGAACIGSGVNVDLDNSQLAVTYELYFNTSPMGLFIAGTGSTITFGPQGIPGLYSAHAVNDTTGCMVMMAGKVEVTINPLPLWFTVTGGGSYCDGGVGVEIGLTGSQLGVRYELLWGPACCCNDSLIATVYGTGYAISFGNITGAGTYAVFATDTTTECTNDMYGCVPVIINPLPTAIVTGDDTICYGESADINVEMTGTPPWNLEFSDGTVHNGIFFTPYIYTVTPAATETYTVIEVSDGNGCINTSTGSATIVVNPLPVVSAGPDVAICYGDCTTLTATGGGDYMWSTGETDASIDVCPTITTTYFVTVTDNNGCSDYASVVVTVNPLPIADAGQDVGICIGACTDLVVSGGGNYDTYEWSTGATTSVINVCPATTTTYAVTVTNEYGCTDTDEVEVTVYPLPDVNASSNSPVCAGDDLELYGTSTAVINSWYWSGPNGFYSTDQNPVITGVGMMAAGMYYLVVYDTNNCVNSDSTEVIVNPLPEIYTVTGGGYYCFGCYGLEIGLDGSEIGIEYTLIIDGTIIDTVVQGTGSAITFGSLKEIPGVYTVLATNVLTGCFVMMNDYAEIILKPAPTAIFAQDEEICDGECADLMVNLTGMPPWSLEITDGTDTTSYNGIMSSPWSMTVCPTVTTQYEIIIVVDSICFHTGDIAVVTVNPLPQVFTVTGSGYYCNGIGVEVGLNGSEIGVDYTLYRYTTDSITTVSGTGGPISFGLQIDGLYTAVAVNVTTGCEDDMSGYVEIMGDPNINTYEVLGGGPYCVGDPGPDIILAGSDVGINYTLLLDGISTGVTLPGTGMMLVFANQTAVGVYTVLAIDPVSMCTRTMIGSAGVYEYPLPEAVITGDATICVGESTLLTVNLIGTAPWVIQISDGTVTTSHTTMITPWDTLVSPVVTTTYTVPMVMDYYCDNVGQGNAVVTVNIPTLYYVTGGGVYCDGGIGHNVGLSGSDSGVEYELYLDGVASGNMLVGTGSPLNFGLQTVAGTYTVVANDIALGCTRNMGGVAIIVVNPLPYLFNVTGGGACCLGCTHLYVGIDDSQYGFIYELILNGVGTGDIQYGTDTNLTWGYMTQEGVYTILATDPYTGCSTLMNGDATVEFWPIPFATLSGDVDICEGDNATLTVTLTSGILPWGFIMTNGVDTTIVLGIQTWSYDYVISPTSTTTYTLISVADSLCFNMLNLSATVTVNYPLAQGYAYSNSPICDGEVLELYADVTPLASITGFEWSGPNGFTSTVQNPVIIGASLAAAGDYYVSIYDINGCFITEMTSVVVNSNPVAYAGPDVAICEGECTMLTATGGTMFVWSTGETMGAITVCPPVTTTYDVTVTDNNGCYDVASVTVTVDPVPNADAGSDVGICVGDCTVLTATGGGTYLWNTGDFNASMTVCPAVTTTYTVFVTNSYGCVASDEVVVTVNPLPYEFNLTGGGCYCIGCTGVEIILDGSETGLEYQLIRNGVMNIGGPVIGDGLPIVFGNFTLTGMYTVAATDPVTGCTNMMLGTIEVVMFPLPTATLSGSADICEGDFATLTVDLTGQSPWTIIITDQTNYDTVYITTTPYTFDVSPSVATTYEIMSVTDTVYGGGGWSVCYNIGFGQAVVNVLPLPQIFTVSGGGYVCIGGPGVDINLDNSELGVRYALLIDGIPSGLELMGTAGPLTFANQNIAGIYTILASNIGTVCEVMMAGYAEVFALPMPQVDFTGLLPNYCMNSAPSLLIGNMAPDGSFSGAGVTDNGDGTAFFDPAAAGVGGPYSIEYTYSDGTCSNTAYHTTTVNAIPTAFNVVGGGGYCVGTGGVDVGLDNSEVGVEYQLYLNSLVFGAPVMGTGAAFSFGLMTDIGYYTVVGTYYGTSCTYNMNGDAYVEMFAVPMVFDVTGGGDYCDGTGGVMVGLSGSEIDVNYELYLDGIATGTVVSGTGSTIDFGLQTLAGTYTAYAMNTYGCGADMAMDAIVGILPSPTADAGPDVAICEGECTTLTATGGSLYVWSTGDQMGVITVCPAQTTTYYVTVTDNNGCYDVASVTVTVNPNPVASAGPDVAICEGECTTLTATGGSLYVWNTGDQMGVITVCPVTTTTYEVTVTDNNGCYDVASVTVTVNPNPVASAGPDVAICEGECTTLTATGGSLYVWSTGDQMGVITVCPATTTTYEVTVTDNNGCYDVASVTVTVNPVPVADAGPDVAICEGVCTTLTATGGMYYEWSTGDQTDAITVCPVVTTEYYVTVTNADGCSAVADVTVTVNTVPVADAGADVSIVYGTSVMLNGSATGNSPFAWLWTPAAGLSDPTIADPDASPAATTIYTLEVTDINGCFDVDDVEVTVTPGADITGYVNYLNTAATAMNNTEVKLIKGSTVVQTVTTDAYGFYQFTSLADDTYLIDGASTKAWGGGNSGDALLIMKHFVGLNTLTGLYLEAGDVNADAVVNTADALNVQQRFVGMIPGFAAGDWVFEKNTVVLAGFDETNDFASLCFGDVNASYTPPFIKVAPSITLETKGTKEITSFVEFELPIYVEQDLSIGAISLILTYPADMVDVLGVELKSGAAKELVYTANNGELRISYYNMKELSLTKNDALIVLSLRAKDLQSNTNNIIPLTLNGRSELADRFATVLSNVKLSAPELVLTSSEFSLGYNYPNPFNNVTEFEYTLPESGNVSLVIYNSIGDKIAVIIDNESKDAGTYKVQFDGSQLAAGIYMYKIEVQGETRNYVKTRSMIVTE